MKKPPESVDVLIEALGGAEVVSKHVGAPSVTIRSWSHRGAIPDSYRSKVVKLAARFAANAEIVGDDKAVAAWKSVDHELLSRISVDRRPRKAGDKPVPRPMGAKVSA